MGVQGDRLPENTNLLVWRRMWTSTLLTGSVEVWTNLSTLLSLLLECKGGGSECDGRDAVLSRRRSRSDKTASSVSERRRSRVERRSKNERFANDSSGGDMMLVHTGYALVHRASRQSLRLRLRLPSTTVFYSYDLNGFFVCHINNYFKPL